MPLKILGLNHTTAPVEIREQVAYSGDALASAVRDIARLGSVDEAVLLSTCNRTEFYVNGNDAAIDEIRAWLLNDQNFEPATRDALFTLDEDAAIRHIFRVASGIESMVLGEPQILGQLKDAVRIASAADAVGPQLDQLMQHAFAVAKKIRTDTAIGASPVSVASAAVSLANQFFAGFSRHTALLIGAGATIELVARHLHSRGIGRLFIANRSIERARDLAKRYSGFAVPLSELEGTLPEADILISSTAASTPIVTAAQMHAAVRARKRRPVFAVDLAVPRDIEENAGQLDDVFLYTVDDLERVIQEGQQNREAAAREAEKLLDEELERYRSMQRIKQAVPVIATLREHANELREIVNQEAQRRIARGVPPAEAVEYASAAMMKKLLHNPSIALRQAGDGGDDAMLEAARTLFGLDKDD